MDNRLDADPLISSYLTRFESYHPKSMDLGLSRTLRLMHDLGDPHLRIPPVIHVAGTNGKGSTIAFLKAILNELGRTCHIMTSPHLVEFRERFVIADHMVTSDALADAMDRIDQKNNGRSATFFELITAVGFDLFAHHDADYTLLETGMGGRLDTTNIIPAPRVTIITMISMDHTQHLGDTLSKIAAEKAGIMKANTPCIIGPQTDEAIAQNIHDVFETHARELNAPLYRHGFEWHYTITPDGFNVDFKGKTYALPRPSLLGAHQYANAATAFVAYLVASEAHEQSHDAARGIAKAVWPARLQKLNGGLGAFINPADELWLDGGHNDTAGQVLAAQITSWAQHDHKDTHLIVGMLTTKNPMEFVEPLLNHAASITAITIPDQPLSFTASDLASRIGCDASSSLEQAIKDIVARDSAPKRILIAGSLYLAGHVLAQDQSI